MAYNRYSKEEKAYLRECIKNEHSLNNAFSAFCKKYPNRSQSAVSVFYYYEKKKGTRAKSTKKKYIKDYEKQLINLVLDNPTNFTKAFKEFAKKYKFSYNSVRIYWYNNISGHPEKFNLKKGKYMVIMSNKHIIPMRKNSTKKAPCKQIKVESSFWQKLVTLLFPKLAKLLE